MSIVLESNERCRNREFHDVVMQRCTHFFDHLSISAAQQECTEVVTLRFDLKPMDPLAWLHGQQNGVKIYWAARDGMREVAGIGRADHVMGAATDRGEYRQALKRMHDMIANSEDDIHYYGGFRFNSVENPDPLWRDFGRYNFVLPRFVIIREGCRYTLSCIFVPDRDCFALDHIRDEWQAVSFTTNDGHDEIPQPLSRRDHPDREQWHRNVQRALKAFGSNDLDKIVLARRSMFSFDEALHPFSLLHRLKKATPECYHFYFQPHSDNGFIGASPERLYKRVGRYFESESVAGTRPRGATPELDDQLADALLSSDKDVREHGFVRDSMMSSLEPLCESLRVDEEISLLKLARGQHLLTGFQGRLNSSVSDIDLLETLHPTPAVGGCPTEKALEKLSEWEGFDRGFYAAPMGWIGRDAAEFAVAIRSGLIAGNRLFLFSGAGIVEGSTPEREWQEIEHKIADFMKVLTEP